MNEAQTHISSLMELMRQELNVKVVSWAMNKEETEWLCWDGKELWIEKPED